MPELKSGWSRKFDEPITLPDSRVLITLRDAANYVTALPGKEANTPEWQAAIEAFILVADLNGPTMFARIGIMRALNRGRAPASSIRRARIIIGAGENSRGTNDRLDLRRYQQGSWRPRSHQGVRKRGHCRRVLLVNDPEGWRSRMRCWSEPYPPQSLFAMLLIMVAVSCFEPGF
jgi:hypothetical protein